MLIGFTGRRHVGKSEAAGFLEAEGFRRVHVFDGGKAAAAAYFRHLGATVQQAHEMVAGGLRDVPSSLLPNNAHPREFLEKLGYWWGVTLGPQWTLGVELARIKRDAPFADVVVESVVYEAHVFREAGGVIVRVSRPGVQGPAGIMTDGAQAAIEADVEIVNDGSLDDLRRKVRALVPRLAATG